MVNDVPDVEQCVKYTQSGVLLPDELEQRRGASRQLDVRKPDILGCTQRHDDEKLIPQRVAKTRVCVRPGHPCIRVDLVPVGHTTGKITLCTEYCHSIMQMPCVSHGRGVRLSFCRSHSAILSKRCKLGSRNLHG